MCSLHLTVHTHLEQWGADVAAPGEQLGVRCLVQGSHHSCGQFLLEPRFEPTTSGYKSNTLSIRPRLPPSNYHYYLILFYLFLQDGMGHMRITERGLKLEGGFGIPSATVCQRNPVQSSKCTSGPISAIVRGTYILSFS